MLANLFHNPANILLGLIIQSNTDSLSSGGESFFDSTALTWILINVVFVLFCIVLYLAYSLSKKKTKKVMVGNEEFKKLKSAYDGLNKEFKTIKKENISLKSSINLLKEKIEDLEGANRELLIQKERIAENAIRLEELQRQKEDLFAIAIHDIKNPISAIRGYVQLLEGYDLNAMEQHEIIQCLSTSTARILDLAYEMNKVVMEAETEEEPKEKKDTQVYDVIKSVISQNQAYAGRKQVRLMNNSSESSPKVKIPYEKLEEVLFNLINNAIKFSPPSTIVQVKSYFSDDKLTIDVIDNGVGINKDDLPNAFTKGGILSAKPTGGEKSTGLGLWIVKKIVEENGGAVGVTSKENVGSTFSITLPRA